MIYPYLYVNGQFPEKDKALIPVYDLGLLRGFGVFDFFRVLDGIAIFAEDHIERLQNSLKIMDLQVNYSPSDWADKFNEMIRLNKAESGGFRVVVTGGFSEDGYSIPEEKNVYMMLHMLPPNDPKQFTEGVHVLTSDYRREIPTAKTTIYIQSMYMQPQIKKAGAYEVLFHWNGDITECSRCNFFVIDKNGTLITPTNGMLRGITRKKVIQIANENNIPVIERSLHINELPEMAGAFLTATTKGILPIVKVGDQVIGDGKVHPLCFTLQEKFQEKVDQYVSSARLAQIVM